jgi:hypothetical protein
VVPITLRFTMARAAIHNIPRKAFDPYENEEGEWSPRATPERIATDIIPV